MSGCPPFPTGNDGADRFRIAVEETRHVVYEIEADSADAALRAFIECGAGQEVSSTVLTVSLRADPKRTQDIPEIA
ncbi:hypothetical protein [uncultured Alsobacter sp.]|uniref:hypothetical protein n=1 Tax=uncultured Alsobacter sp. TaxID=1748258 RepID=UPI0025F1D3EA|nr:hypothetical protein [uncultured Alsobacter sp.]